MIEKLKHFRTAVPFSLISFNISIYCAILVYFHAMLAFHYVFSFTVFILNRKNVNIFKFSPLKFLLLLVLEYWK